MHSTPGIPKGKVEATPLDPGEMLTTLAFFPFEGSMDGMELRTGCPQREEKLCSHSDVLQENEEAVGVGYTLV